MIIKQIKCYFCKCSLMSDLLLKCFPETFKYKLKIFDCSCGKYVLHNDLSNGMVRGGGLYKTSRINWCQVSGVRCQVSVARCQMSGVRCQVSGVRCQVSGVRCQLSGVRCHLTHVTNANRNRHGPSLFVFPPMHSTLVCKDKQHE